MWLVENMVCHIVAAEKRKGGSDKEEKGGLPLPETATAEKEQTTPAIALISSRRGEKGKRAFGVDHQAEKKKRKKKNEAREKLWRRRIHAYLPLKGSAEPA